MGQHMKMTTGKLKMNQEMQNKFKSLDTIIATEVRRLEWLRHVVRMGGERTGKKLLEGKPGAGRKKRKTQIKMGEWVMWNWT